jgi:hypothetical protein
MRPRLKLSSSLTFFSEWIFLVVWLVVTFVHIRIALTNPEYPMPVGILWGIGLIFVLIYSWSIKKVTIEGDYFVISNYFISRRAPITHLSKIGKSYFSRGPMIILYFEPPTPFGKRVRIIPPGSSKSSEDEIMAFLQSLIDNRESA